MLLLNRSSHIAVTPNQNPAVGSPVPAQAQAQMQMLQRQSMTSSMQPVLPTPTKKWYGTYRARHVRVRVGGADGLVCCADHLADRLLGDDPCKSLSDAYGACR